MGVDEALAAQAGAAVPMTYVSKEKLTKDMQFRGAISDFHPIKEHIINSDYDPLLLRGNPDDLYGDGNNFEASVAALICICTIDASASGCQSQLGRLHQTQSDWARNDCPQAVCCYAACHIKVSC